MYVCGSGKGGKKFGKNGGCGRGSEMRSSGGDFTGDCDFTEINLIK